MNKTNKVNDATSERITIDLHPILYKRLKKIISDRKSEGDTCSMSELIRKSIIKFLKEGEQTNN